ncbi:MAG: acyltransferase [Muribaculaceae bacterium]
MITSITKGPRQSNIELLRIIAMFLVLIVHADYWSLGVPSLDEYASNPVSSVVRAVIEGCAIICVNVFICISGWFGIKSTIKGLFAFLFQSVFLVSLTYIFAIIYGSATFSLSGIRECLFIKTTPLWFVLAYLGLYILAPILNKYVETAEKKQFLGILMLFFTFQTLFGISGSASFVMSGYSVFSFVGLYLLSRFINKYGIKFKRSIIIGGGISLVTSILLHVLLHASGHATTEYFYTYISPLVIWTSLAMVLLFNEIQIRPNKIINWISRSAFAVYIIHQSPFIAKPYFKPAVQNLFENYSGIACLISIFVLLLGYFIISIIIDKSRIFIWNRIASRIKWQY